MQYKNKWLYSYETILFDTPDGDLGEDQYADHPDGGYYIRLKPKNRGQFIQVDSEYDVSTLQKVNIIAGKAYYSEFLTAIGAVEAWKPGGHGVHPKLPLDSFYRCAVSKEDYWNVCSIKNHKQPERLEEVGELPPSEPLQPHNLPHSISYDAVSSSGEKTSVSSFSWSHTCGANAAMLVIGSGFDSGDVVDVSTVTYNGDSATLGAKGTGGGTPDPQAELYYLIDPDTGSSYTIAVTLSDTVNYAAGAATSYSTSDTAQIDDTSSADGNTISDEFGGDTVTTVENNCWVVAFLCAYNASASFVCATPDETERYELRDSQKFLTALQDYGPKTPAGEKLMNWSVISNCGVVGTVYWAIATISFSEATTPEEGSGDAGVLLRTDLGQMWAF